MTNYLYTVTNRQSANAVIGMKILANGGLEFLPGSPYLTGGKGSRSSQSQNGVWIPRDLLFASISAATRYGFPPEPRRDADPVARWARPVAGHGAVQPVGQPKNSTWSTSTFAAPPAGLAQPGVSPSTATTPATCRAVASSSGGGSRPARQWPTRRAPSSPSPWGRARVSLVTATRSILPPPGRRRLLTESEQPFPITDTAYGSVRCGRPTARPSS